VLHAVWLAIVSSTHFRRDSSHKSSQSNRTILELLQTWIETSKISRRETSNFLEKPTRFLQILIQLVNNLANKSGNSCSRPDLRSQLMYDADWRTLVCTGAIQKCRKHVRAKTIPQLWGAWDFKRAD
jgi:hypothetical protein